MKSTTLSEKDLSQLTLQKIHQTTCHALEASHFSFTCFDGMPCGQQPDQTQRILSHVEQGRCIASLTYHGHSGTKDAATHKSPSHECCQSPRKHLLIPQSLPPHPMPANEKPSGHSFTSTHVARMIVMFIDSWIW